MSICVDIADRQFDYTDEEKAAEAIAEFQADMSMNDDAVLDLWNSDVNPMKAALEAKIFAAVDANGSSKRANETIPGNISLFVTA